MNLVHNIVFVKHANKMTVGKNRKNYDGKKALVIKELAKSFSVSESYIRMAINGDANNVTTNEIKKHYKHLRAEIEKVFK